MSEAHPKNERLEFVTVILASVKDKMQEIGGLGWELSPEGQAITVVMANAIFDTSRLVVETVNRGILMKKAKRDADS